MACEPAISARDRSAEFGFPRLGFPWIERR